MRPINPALAGRTANPMYRLGERAFGRTDLIRLEFGEPGFATPAHIVEAAISSIRQERQGYGPTNGPLWLREAIAERAAHVSGAQAAPGQVIVTAGGTGALTISLLVLCVPGDEVLVPDPGWPGYDGILATSGTHCVRYPLLPFSGWQPDLAALDALVTPRTRVLLVNTPSNPGGAVFKHEAVEGLVAFARRHDLWILSDECYDELVFDGRHVSLLEAEASDGRVLCVGTCSKSYAMTGWRVGWVVAPPELAPALSIAAGAQVNNLPLFTVRAAHAALTGPQQCVAEMRAAYQQRRELALDALRAHGLADYTPEGAFYLLVDVARARHDRSQPFDSVAFAEALLAERGIVVAPGGAFGETIPDYVRISLAGEPEPLRAGLEGTLDFARSWSG